MRRALMLSAAVSLAAIVMLTIVAAQSTGTIRGVITDSSGAVLPGVIVTISGAGTAERSSVTNALVAEALAYANRLVQLVGELLGLDTFTAMECTFADARWLVYTENGDMVAIRPKPDANLGPLRQRLGL